MIEKFSKPSSAVIKNKKSFFDENEIHLQYVRDVNAFYLQQPLREFCKNCGIKISEVLFVSQEVPYSLCRKCNHLNGIFEDSEEFANYLYKDNGGDNYKENYLAAYASRVQDIYLPKARFLLETLKPFYGHQPVISVLDIGCGGGHFINACEEAGISAVGVDPNQALVDLAAEKVGKHKVSICDLDDIDGVIRNAEQDVISLIGVLEHLRHPRNALRAFKDSKSKYIYLQVPLFSLSVLLEHANQDVFPRQLNAGHTHLYTKESLDYLFDEFDLQVVSEWWFGTDIVDIFRQLVVKSNYIDSEIGNEVLKKYFGNFIDDLQGVLDRDKKCSGVNMVIEKRC